MASAEMEVDAATAETGQEEPNILEEPSSLKEENNDEKEDVSAVQSTSKALDSKSAVDPKSRIARGTKRMRDADSSHSAEKKVEAKDDPEAEAKIMRSLKRSCELWSMEDKNTFFKAVNEFGKDFDALQSYFLIQGKKKGLPEKMIKNKEQIRHFYYRTWLKISKHLKFSEDVKKTSQELYGLINYGELRRKLPRMHEKVQMKLNELVYWGSTQVRLRGKTMRIKTPICRALRKLNQLEGWQEDIKLPSRVTIELRPGNNLTWWQVQALAMNPRVRTLVPIQRRLSSILSFLQQRWRPWKAKTSADVENLINLEGKNMRLLRVTPPEGCKITLPVVNLGEYLTSNSVSLNSYENRLGLKSSRIELLGSMQYLKGVGKKNVKKYKGDKRLSTKSDEMPDNSDIDLPESSAAPTSEKVSVSNVEKPLVEQPSTSSGGGFPGRETVERIRLGWNVEEANTITVGDLFLMFGRDSKIVLEYWWESPVREATTEKTNPIEQQQDNSLSLALQKLLSIAKHSYGTSKGYDNVSGSNETVISSRIPSTKESTFRRPLIPQTYHKMGAPEAFKTQLDKYKSRFSRRGRILRQRSLVVQRVLPSTPQTPQHQISYPEVRNVSVGTKTSTMTEIPSNESNIDEPEKRIELTIESPQKHFLNVLEARAGGEVAKVTNSNSSITSAMQILKEGEQQWLNSEVADFSLSSFLGQLESPVKGSQRSQAEVPMIEIIRPSSDVANMHCLMGENSVDYMAKFANLASQIASSEEQKK
ncbi:protein cramped isoform X1 [Nasonia vitripennis]|uniref:Protein cramped n=1 Tax=Nasonia vitripennis TaxID=7425 RepID=A0A7M7IRF3_NASVI|nr:protein cramped isoform X1 [Nasonia vitripennis]XP_016839014.1 protein cramped isoform X1 [Nasonia vitripennis]XP_031783429.1 protein cramped isoform X1 [Nasonia vitripennis]